MDSYILVKQELEIIRAENDKLKRQLSESEANNLQVKLAYLNLENDYERERMKRMNVVGWVYLFHPLPLVVILQIQIRKLYLQIIGLRLR